MKTPIPYDEHFKNVINVVSTFGKASREHYEGIGLQYTEVPVIVGITGACENVDTLFAVRSRLEIPLFLTQTGQLALELALAQVPGVYTIIHSARDEEEEDARHLRQFRLTEEEFDCTMEGMTRENYDEDKMYEALLQHIEKATKAIISGVLKEHKDVLKNSYNRNTEALEKIVERPYLRITYEDSLGLLNKNGFPELKWGDDLKSEHEAKIAELMNIKENYGKDKQEFSPIFIMKYPKEIKFFNMKVSTKDDRVALSADLIFPFSGESVGSAVREEDGKKLKERLLTSTMFDIHRKRGGKYEDFYWYVEETIMPGKTNPHAGYGIGNERLLQFIFGQDDIRVASMFSLMEEKMHDWSRDNRKKALISIGQDEDKKKLLPYLKQLAKITSELYATEGTAKFMQENNINAKTLYKISEEKTPNIAEYLEFKRFDLIVNIPNHKKPDAITDGSMIRKKAIEKGIPLYTAVDVAENLVHDLVKKKNGNGK